MKVAARRVARILADAKQHPNSTDWVRVADQCLLLLALPKRKVRPRDPRKAERKATVKELDALCRKVVFARARDRNADINTSDGALCEWCWCNVAVDWAHFYSRRFKWLRWSIDPQNSAALCKGCHLKWHHRPSDGAAWVRHRLGPREHDRLVALAARPQKTDLSLVRISLEQEAKRLGVKV